jgi:hypothetical protein
MSSAFRTKNLQDTTRHVLPSSQPYAKLYRPFKMWRLVFNRDVIGGNLMASVGQTKVNTSMTYNGEKVSSNYYH